MSKETGGPAFPSNEDIKRTLMVKHSEGMTLRDYFAAKAMQAIMGNEFLIKRAIDGGFDVEELVHSSAADAYEMADAPRIDNKE